MLGATMGKYSVILPKCRHWRRRPALGLFSPDAALFMAEAKLKPGYGMDMKKLTREGKEETGSRGSILERLNIRSASSGPPSISTSLFTWIVWSADAYADGPTFGHVCREQFAPVMNPAVSIDGFCYH
jgi:hypothetical protein